VVTPTGVQAATAYLADSRNPLLRPYDWYKDFVIAGADEHRLPDAYVQWLRTIDSQPDPNRVRSAKWKALLSDV